MITFRFYAAAPDQGTAESIASGYLFALRTIVRFETKLVQPYWKISGLYEIYLESAGGGSSGKEVFSRLVSLAGGTPQFLSETEAIWSDLDDDFFLPYAKWAHAELIGP